MTTCTKDASDRSLTRMLAGLAIVVVVVMGVLTHTFIVAQPLV